MGILTFKAMLQRNKHGALIAVIIALALILCLSVHCKKTSTPDAEESAQSKELAETSESIYHNDELPDRIMELVRGLEYPDEVAENFTRMVIDWKDELGRPALIRWKEELAEAHRDYQRGKITRNQVAKIEERIVQELCEKIKKEFSPKELTFELSDVIENRRTDCLGCSQLTYIIGNGIGLSVKPIDVLDLVTSLESNAKGHIACIVYLFNRRSVMADVTWPYDPVSRAFKLEDNFVKVGNYWELGDKYNRLQIHRRIRLLDRKGLIAGICNNRGHVYQSRGEYDRAILEYNKAIENDPIFTKAYSNRGNTYSDKGEYERAILDYMKAIEIDPEYAIAYTNRGNAFDAKGEYDRAIVDHTKAIKINSKFTEAYNNRGIAHAHKGDYDQAILDYAKAIEIDPKYAMAYTNRGNAFDAKGEYDRAIADHTKAIEINPKFAGAYNNRANAYADKGEYGLALLDYEKVIEIDPEFALAYLNRGDVYAELGRSEEAKKDLLKAIDLDPELKDSVKKVSERHKLDLKLD